MKRSILLSLVLILNLHATETYNVDDLTMKALENAPDLKMSSLNYDASKSRYDAAMSEYLPKVNLHADLTTGQTSDIPLNPDDMKSNNSILGNLSLNQIIYDFGKTSGNSDSFKYDAESFSSEYKQEISNKIKDVRTAYFNVLQSIALISVHEENVALNKSQHYRAKKYFEAGIKTIIDVSDAKVELLSSQLDLRKANYDLELSYTKLNEVVGFQEIKTDYRIYSQTLDFTKLYSSIKSYPLSLEESVNFSYENRNTIKKQMAFIQSAEAQNTLISSEYYPSLYFGADYTMQNTDKQKSTTPKNMWTASVNMDWNLYQGGASDARNEESETQLAAAKSELAYTKLQIKSNATQAYINVNRAKDSVELAQSILQVSNEKFHQASKRYENDLSDFIELQQARQGYIDAMASLVVNYYDYYIAVANLDNAIGK